jgi:hypothetical protein
MDVDCVMLPIVVDVHAEIEGVTTEIMHPEPLLHVVVDLAKQALISNDEEIIDVLSQCGNDYDLMLMMEHEQSSVHT